MLDRFMSKVLLPTNPNDCWVWQGSFQKSGKHGQALYPNVRVKGKTWRGHRLAFVLFHGAIPAGNHILHKCDNTKCVNPAHLFSGTHVDNMQDKLKKNRDHNKIKTHCLNGHPFAGDNLIVRKDGARSCRTCMRAYWKKHDAKRKGRR